MSDHTRPVEIQLAVLDSKLDGIKTTLDVRLNHIEERISANAADIKSVERHDEAGRIQQADAFAKLLERKTDKVQSEERYSSILDRVQKVESNQTWIGRAVILAVVLAVIGGGAIYKKEHDQAQKPPAAVAQ